MFSFLRLLLEAFGPTLGWVVVFAAAVIGAFVVYIGVALLAALFHSKKDVRLHAADILRQLLDFFARGGRR